MRGGKPGFYPEIKGKGGPGGHFLLNLWDPFNFTAKRTVLKRRPFFRVASRRRGACSMASRVLASIATPSPRRLLDGVAVWVIRARRRREMTPRKTQAEQKERGLKCEILNGRAAMLGIMGMLSASTVPGSVPFLSGIEGFPQYAGNVMVPFSNDFTLTSMA